MKKFKSFFNRNGMASKALLIMVIVLGVSIMILNIGATVVFDFVVSESTTEKINYNLDKIINDFNNKLIGISDSIDAVAMDSRFRSYIEKSRYERENSDSSDEIRYIGGMCNVLENSVSGFDFLSVEDDDGNLLRFGNAYDSSIDELELELMRDIYNRQDVGKIMVVGDIKPYGEDTVFVISKKYRMSDKPVIFNIGVSKTEFTDILRGIYPQDGENVIVVSGEEKFEFSLVDATDKMIDFAKSGEEGAGEFEENGEKFIVSVKQSYLTGDKFCYTVNKSAAMKKYSGIKLIYFLFGIFILIIALIVVKKVSVNLFSTLINFSNRFNDFTQELTQKSISSDINISSITDAENVCDETFRQIKELVAYVSEREKQLSSIEKRALQEQINPHFLYNTLGMIQMVSEMHDDDEVASMISILGDLLRYGLSLKNEGLVELREEFKNISDYVALAEYGLKYGARLSIDVDERLQSVLIPKMTLQPIIENCFRHGNLGKKQEGRIDITCEAGEGSIRLIVRDNGDGLKGKPERAGGIGLKNVEKRLQIYFDGKAEINVTGKNPGCEVTLVLPY